MKQINKYLFSALAFSASAGQAGAQQLTVQDLKPFKNVIFIVGDDHTKGVIGAYGNKIVRTPNLDRLAKSGVRFEHAYASSPICSPSRQSLLTGKFPHATGVSLLQSSFPEEQVTLADYLTPLGFKTAIIGKNHFNNTLNHGFEVKIERKDHNNYLSQNPPDKLPDSIKVRPDFKLFVDSTAVCWNSKQLPSPLRDKDQPGVYYTNKSIEFINQNKNERFFLWIGFEEPHMPFNFPVEFAGRYNPNQFTLPQGSPEDDRWIPLCFKNLTETERKGIIASYYTSVEYLDKNIGLVLDAVEKAGLTDSTLIIYVGDNGYQLNDHKRFEKHTMWEEAVGAPLILKAGKAYGENRKVEALTQFVDLVPTVIEALGVKPLENIHGKSLVPLLTNKTDSVHDCVFSEYFQDNRAMIRTTKWKYVFITGEKDLDIGYATGNAPAGSEHFLYDEVIDPKETHNLAYDSKNKEILLDLKNKMLKNFEDTHPKGKLSDKLTIDEKLTIYCHAPELQVN